MRQIIVRRAEDAWSLNTGSDVIYFMSGAQAERRARDMAAGLAAGGVPAEVAVFDLSGRPVGRVSFPAAA